MKFAFGRSLLLVFPTANLNHQITSHPSQITEIQPRPAEKGTFCNTYIAFDIKFFFPFINQRKHPSYVHLIFLKVMISDISIIIMIIGNRCEFTILS